MPEVVDEIHRVVFVDGIWIARDLVVLIACSEPHVLSWHLARAETASAWRSPLSRIAPPDMVVADGGSVRLGGGEGVGMTRFKGALSTRFAR